MHNTQWWNLRVLSVVTMLALTLVSSHAAISGFPVGNYQLIASTRVTRTVFDYTYKATLTNSGPVDALNLTATVKSKSGKTTITDNALRFGDVSAGGKVVSTDTFTIRQDRSVPFDPTDLIWTVKGNARPVANAGADQSAKVNQTVQLDGSTSSDMDGDELTFRWTILNKPVGSTATLSSPTVVQPTFAVDKAGTYEFQLIVNDGSADSAADTIKISTTNSAPSANAGPDQTVKLNSLVTLNGSGSKDPDGDSLTYQWTLITKPQSSTATLTNPTTVSPTFTADKPGAYHARLIVNDGKVASTEDIVIVSTENSAPVANAGPDLNGTVSQLVQLDGSGSNDVDGDTLSYQWSFVSVPATSNAVLSDTTVVNPTFTPDVAGMYVVQLIANDGKVNSVPDSAKVTVTVGGGGGCTPGATQACYSGPASTQGVGLCKAGTQTCGSNGTFGACVGEVLPATEVPGNAVDENCDGLTPECSAGTTRSCYSGPAGTAGVGICKAGTQTCGSNGSFGSCTGQVVPATEIANNGIDEDCNGADQTTGGTLPPDPATVALVINQTVTTTIGAATAFLYTGANPIQTGVAPGTIEARRAAVLRGKVLDRNNAPLPSVKITVLNHSEFGQTLSRADGMFDLAVNGGGLLTLVYEKSGFLPAQRQVDVLWQDFALAEDAILVPFDPKVTPLDLASPTLAVVRGSVVNDAEGTRQATLLVAPGTTAQMVMPNGSTQPLSMLHVRATEYTVGANGSKAMPAPLPPTSGYTYAVEYSVDEAVAAGATEVRFNRPLFHYVENFLNFPVGMAVPAGYYDKTKGQWIPSDNGRVIKIISIANGLAEIDTNGNNVADNDPTLGLTDAERRQLAGLYSVGKSLWRVPITHFTPWDCNWPFGPPQGAQPPPPKPVQEGGTNPEDPASDHPAEDPCSGESPNAASSIIDCQNQVLQERIDITGSPYSLYYSSDRVSGWQAADTVKVRLSDSGIPPTVKQINLEIKILGETTSRTYTPGQNVFDTFKWSRRDVYGRSVVGPQNAELRVGYVYDGQYTGPANVARSFGAFGTVPITGNRTRQEVTLWRETPAKIGSWQLPRKSSEDGPSTCIMPTIPLVECYP